MLPLLRPIADYLRDSALALKRGWNYFWFSPKDPTTLGAVRFCTGAVVLYIHICCAAHVLDLIGPDGWIDHKAAQQIQSLENRVLFSSYNRAMPDGGVRGISESASLQEADRALEKVLAAKTAGSLTDEEVERIAEMRRQINWLALKEGLDPDDLNLLATMRSEITEAVANSHDADAQTLWASADQTIGRLLARKASLWERMIAGNTGLSIYYLVQNPTAVIVIYTIFVIACFCFMIGLFTRTTTVIVWLGHLSYIWRSYNAWFGMDTIILMLTFYLMFAPSGAALSVDRLIRRFRDARRRLGTPGRPGHQSDLQPSWGANVVLRMIQLHMCIVYLSAGAAKLQGNRWWDGTAIWMTLVCPEFALFDMSWLGGLDSDWPWLLVSTLGSFFTIAFEVGFIFLIWHPRLRPLVLFLALVLHAGIGIFMGLGGFGAIMLTGCLAFVSPASLRWLMETVFKGWTGFKFAYDSASPGQLRAARWVDTADVFNQVELTNVNRGAEALPAGTLVTPNRHELSGTSAFWQLFRSLRVMWLLWPLAIWPFRSLRAEPRPPHWKPHAATALKQVPAQ